MKITSDRWHMISIPVMAAIMAYLALGDLMRHTTGGLVVGSLTLWNIFVMTASLFWWWPRRRAFQAAVKKPPRRAGMVVMSSIVASALASVGLMLGGIALLEQDSLGLQVPGVMLLVLAALMFPGWSVWFIRWTIRRTNAASV